MSRSLEVLVAALACFSCRLVNGAGASGMVPSGERRRKQGAEITEIAKNCEAVGTPSCAVDLPQLGRLLATSQYTLARTFNAYDRQSLARQLGEAAFEQTRKVKNTVVQAMEQHTHARLAAFCSGKSDCRGLQKRATQTEICGALPFCEMAQRIGLAFDECKIIASEFISEQTTEELKMRCMQEPHEDFYCTELEDQIFQKHPTCYHDLFVQTFNPEVAPRCEPICVNLWREAEEEHPYCSRMFTERNRRILEASSGLASEVLAHIRDLEGLEEQDTVTFQPFQDTCMGTTGARRGPMGGRGSRTPSMMV